MRIDVHFHIVPEFYREAVYAAGAGPAIGRFPDWSPELALEVADANGIEVAITSVSYPAVSFLPREAGRALARRCNEYAAELRARWPARFGAFALVPMHDPKDAAEEIHHVLNERGAVVFVHPTYSPSSKSLDLPFPGFMLEYPFDTSRAAVNLLFSGALERFPRVRFILAHAGGTVPYLAWRLSVSPMISSRLPQWSRETILAGLRRFWYDTALAAGRATMASLGEVAAPDRILFGSDWPFANARVVAEEVKDLTAPGFLSETQRAAIDRENAVALFPRFT
ncbi:MAG: amidohydrolase family protein [Dehalococcoidia bacterium]|nr:amidohydrolase family protein [Dehalococcoidia bacterium]